MYLHSNMVRFIICGNDRAVCGYFEFTFQYGQIYYINDSYYKFSIVIIYIPIWLDLLYTVCPSLSYSAFIFTFQYGQIYYVDKSACGMGKVNIYIPIWLDLLQCRQ